MAWVEAHGDKWRGRYCDPTGRKYNVPVQRSKKTALRMATEEEVKMRTGGWIDPAAGTMTLGRAAAERRCARVAHPTPPRIPRRSNRTDGTVMSTEEKFSAELVADRLLTPDEVADRLSVGVQWVYGAARRGALPCIRVGRYVRFEEAAIEAWIETQRTKS